MRIIFFLTLLGGLFLLALAVWPGLLENTVIETFFVCLWVPLFGFWFLLLVGLALRDLFRRGPPGRRRWGLWSAGIMFATLALLWFHVPQRIGLSFCHGELRRYVDDAPADEFRGTELGLQIGLYQVDRYARDERGGVYFRTATGPDGIGPDQMSYGFAFRPNNEGTPFGNANYRRRHLFAQWYAFAVSDDS